MPKGRRYNWGAIRALYEAGESPAHIEQLENMPSRQAIHVKAKQEDWTVIDKFDEGLEHIPFSGLSDEQRFVIQEVSNGATQRMAANLAGIREKTVSDWKKDDNFARALLAAKAFKARRRLGKIEASKEWRASLALLERDPDTRSEWTIPQQTKPQGHTFNVLGHVHLGIERDADNRLPEDGEQPSAVLVGGDGDEQEGEYSE